MAPTSLRDPPAGRPKRGLKVTFDQFAASLSPLSKNDARDANWLHNDNMIVLSFPKLLSLTTSDVADAGNLLSLSRGVASSATGTNCFRVVLSPVALTSRAKLQVDAKDTKVELTLVHTRA